MAGALAAGDVVVSFVRSIGQGCQHASSPPTPATQAVGSQTREEEAEAESMREAETVPTVRRKSAARAEGKPV
jgi:hypothetical protein